MFEDVPARLTELAARDPQLRVFGADAHRYQLRPPMAESRLREIERAHEVTLPSDYREFLLRVGSGGAGPCHGLLPLDSPHQLASLDGELPYGHSWTPNLDDPTERHLVESMGPYGSDFWVRGSVALADMGCAFFYILAVRQPRVHGAVFADLRSAGMGVVQTHASFAEFYEEWLSTALGQTVEAPRSTMCRVPRERCSFPRALLNLMGSHKQKLGLAPSQDLAPDALRNLLMGIGDSGIVTRAGGSDRHFDDGDPLRLCHCCRFIGAAYIAQGMMRPSQFVPGVGPKAERA
jgi:hypothetical protein